jgi:Kelch motif
VKLEWMCSVLAIAASCGFPRPPDVGEDGSSTCRLTAVAPALANTGDAITIEGTFGDSVTVSFPGGATVTATLLGPHRARAIVPASATEGDLTVTTCGTTIGALHFRRASFTLGIGQFAAHYEQMGSARQYPTLTTPRRSHTSLAVGGSLYVLGGNGTRGVLDSVEQAMINADGTLGQFAITRGTLSTPRQAHTTAALGNKLYVIGGFNSNSLNSVEQATIAADGSLSPFDIISDVTLAAARHGHATAVVGTYLYVLGGINSSPLASVERATIGADGSLGPLSIVQGVTLTTARHSHSAVVAGDYLYVLGGADADGALRDVERARIDADGSLGVFEAVPDATLVTERAGHSSEIIGNRVYLMGGIDRTGVLRTVESALLANDGSLGAFEEIREAQMRSSRHGHTTTVVGNYTYALGGSSDIGLHRIGEHATLNVSGGLGPFEIVPGGTLTELRARHVGVVLGRYLYLIGGGVGTTSIERATVNADGSLGPFTAMPELTLVHPRDFHTAAVIGRYLYLLGGGDSAVERAEIGIDGSLGSFERAPNVQLVTQRGSAPSAFVAGNYLYVAGGNSSPDTAGESIERALINADGSLEPFALVTGTNLAARRGQVSMLLGYRFYIVGGSDLQGNRIESSERASASDSGILSSFTLVQSPVPYTISRIQIVAGNYYYSIDQAPSFTQRSTIDHADGSFGSVDTLPERPAAGSRFAPTTTVIGNYVYLAGGALGRAILTSTERAELR